MTGSVSLRYCIVVATFCCAAIFVVGCGDDAQVPSTPIELVRPQTPVAAECGLTGEGSARNAERPPKPGTYTFRLKGRRELIGERKRVTKLPAKMTLIVTEALSDGAQSCVAMQRRFERDLGDTGVFVINGSDTLLRSGRFQAGADVTEFTPDPPILAISGSELEWSGKFGGDTTGRYESSIVERKRMRIGEKSLRVVGIKTRVTYSGEIEGFEQSTRWVSLNDNLVVAESVTQEREFGLDRLLLRYSTELISIDPE